MTKLQDAFSDPKTLVAFTVAGDPNMQKSVDYVLSMVNAGADAIELGIPFSDPTADGPVVQAGGLRAFASGITTTKVFEIVKMIRAQTDVPLVFLSYLNKLFDYGYQAFFEKCQELDVNGVVIPDLPYEERGEIADLAEGHGVSIIPLVAPTSGDRIQKIVKDSTGFVYLVSSLGITGVRDDNEMSHDLSASVAEIKKYTDAPIAVGFGIHTPEQVEKMNEIADGAIIGSGIVKLVENNPDNASAAIEEYVKAIKA